MSYLQFVHRVFNPVIYACSYGKFRYRIKHQIALMGKLVAAMCCCNWIEWKRLWALGSERDQVASAGEGLLPNPLLSVSMSGKYHSFSPNASSSSPSSSPRRLTGIY